MSPSSVALLFILSTLPSLSLQDASQEGTELNGGLVIELVHRDSPRSPVYNPGANHFITRFDPSSREHGHSWYFMRLSIGTPPVEVMLLMDTGSDLIWTQCLPCVCYPQADPIFDPTKSSTYAMHTCDSMACNEHSATRSCTGDDDKCIYGVSYGYGGMSGGSRGILSSDTFTITSSDGLTVSFPDMLFGCGHDNHALFSGYGGRGGLGGGSSSLIFQLGMQTGAWRFSYCLAPPWSEKKGDSHLYIGDNAVFLGNSTPLAVEPSEENIIYYYLKLEDISVGSKRLHIPPGTFDKTSNNPGGVIIDSSATWTKLNQKAFHMMAMELRKMIDLEPTGSDFILDYDQELCFKGNREDLVEENIPILTFHFSGLDVPLHPSISFIEDQEDVVCLAMQPTDGITVIGNHAQQNMNIGYDLDNEKLTMAPVDCSNY